MGGGLLQLVTIGAQDVFISGDPQITFFKLVYKRHTNFAIESKPQIANGTIDPASGGRSDITIKREGDLINHMYLRIPNPPNNDAAICKTMAKTFITNVINQNIYVENAREFEKNMDIMITAGVWHSAGTSAAVLPRSVYRTTIINIDYDSNILTITGKYPVVKYKAGYAVDFKLGVDYKYENGFILDDVTSRSIFAGTKCPFQVVEVRGHSTKANGDGQSTINQWKECASDIWTAVSGIRGISGDMYSNPVRQPTGKITLKSDESAELVAKIGETILQTASGFVGILTADVATTDGGVVQYTIIAGTLKTTENLLVQQATAAATTLITLAKLDTAASIVTTNGFSSVSASGYVLGGQSLGGSAQAERFDGLPYDMILPTSNTGTAVSWLAADGSSSACCAKNLNGYKLIQYIELLIGGQVIDKITGDLLDMWNELTITNGNKEQFNLMTSLEESAYCYLPLYFWFNKSPGLALPLIALQYHEVTVRIVWEAGLPIASNFSPTLFIDYIYLDSAERRRFAQSTHQYLVEIWQQQEPPINADLTQARLIFNHPVKELLWRARLNNGNYVSWNDIALKFNGSDRLSSRHSDYFQRVQPFYHHSAIPNKIHGIHCFSFAIKPEEHQPSGTCNFSRLDNVMLHLNGLRTYDGRTTQGLQQFNGSTTNTTIKLNVYALAYNVLNIMSGMGALAFAN